MTKIKSFTNLEVYELSNELAINLTKWTRNLPPKESYRITDQLLRAIYSVGANIAEGFGRYHRKDFIRFLYVSRGSLFEVKHFLILSRNIGYLDDEKFMSFENQINIIGIKLNNLISSLSKINNQSP